MVGLMWFVLYTFPKFDLVIITLWNQLSCLWFLLSVFIAPVCSASNKEERARQRWVHVCNATNWAVRNTFMLPGMCSYFTTSGVKKYLHLTLILDVIFHSHSAQAAGLLCEEAGNNTDNVKYCGYCKYHYHKLVSIKSAFLFCFYYIALV